MAVNKRYNTTILISSVIWMFLALCANSIFADGITERVHTILTLLCLLTYLIGIINWCKVGCRFLSAYVLFMLYAMFSTIGQPIAYLLNVSGELLSVYAFHSIVEVNRYLRFLLLCISGMNVGVAIALFKKRNCVGLDDQIKSYTHNTFKSKYSQILNILTVISWSYVILNCLKMLVMRQSYGYAEFYDMRVASNSMLDLLLSTTAVILFFWSVFHKKHTNILYVCVLITMFLYMIIGVRTQAISMLAILCICTPITHPQFFKKKFIPLWIVMAIFAFAGIGLIATFRTGTIGTSSFTTGNTLIDSLYETITEMGFSARTAILAMEAIDYGFPHHQTILTSIINGFIPFVSNLPLIQNETMHLAEWITDYAMSYNNGIGFCFIGEMYVNFGKLGWIFMIFYGWLVAFLENFAYKRIIKGKWLLAFCILFVLCEQIFYARGEMVLTMGDIRACVYISIIWLIIKMFCDSPSYTYKQ